MIKIRCECPIHIDKKTTENNKAKYIGLNQLYTYRYFCESCGNGFGNKTPACMGFMTKIVTKIGIDS